MSRTTNRTALLLAVAMALAAAGCAITTTPGAGTNAEWIGSYQQQEAARKDQNRAVALRVRDALAADPVLKSLGLRIFADRGEVTLCGHFPDAATRDRAFAVVEQLQGVMGVDTNCGN